MAEAALGVDDFLHLLEGAIAVGIAQAEQAPALVGMRIQRPVRVEQAAAFLEGVVDDRHRAGRGIEAQQAALFPRQGDPPLRIKGQGDPGILVGTGRADEFHLEAFRHLEIGGIGGLLLVLAFGKLPGIVGIEGLFQIEGIGGGLDRPVDHHTTGLGTPTGIGGQPLLAG